MRNIKLLIAYDGTGYAGWQRQKHAPTIQQSIEQALKAMIGEGVALHGAGRTDAGVHAAGMVANFQTHTTIPVSGFVGGLNALLPRDIRILAADEVPLAFHSRFGATGKTYRYHLYTGKINLPTRRLYQAHIPTPFDPDPVQICLRLLLGQHDFSSFETTGSRDRAHTGGRGAVRTIFRAGLEQELCQEQAWIFTFQGDGFLRHMVRALVGTLVRVGGIKMSPEQFGAVLEAKDRAQAAATAPACGLFLERVHYDDESLLTSTG